MTKFFPASVLTLIVTDKCNLACKYCYGNFKKPESMSFETACKAIDVFTNAVDDFRICLFGGEPFVAFDLIKKIVKYVETKKIKATFHVTTNCTLITDKIAKYIKDKQFSIIASIDGPKDIHDNMRKYKNGFGSHKNTLRGIVNLHKAGASINVLRATFGPDDSHLMRRMVYLTGLLEQGYARSISIEPYSNAKPGYSYAGARDFTIKDVAKLESEYFNVCEYISDRLNKGKPVNFRQIQGIAKRLLDSKFYFNECGAGVRIATIGVDGTIYACHRQGNTDIGSIHSGLNVIEKEKWHKSMVEMPKVCLNCEYYMICGGPCREQNLRQGLDINQPDPVLCAFKKLWIECGMRLIRSISCGKDKRKITEFDKQGLERVCRNNA